MPMPVIEMPSKKRDLFYVLNCSEISPTRLLELDQNYVYRSSPIVQINKQGNTASINYITTNSNA